jgi:hypothetical protein
LDDDQDEQATGCFERDAAANAADDEDDQLTEHVKAKAAESVQPSLRGGGTAPGPPAWPSDWLPATWGITWGDLRRHWASVKSVTASSSAWPAGPEITVP